MVGVGWDMLIFQLHLPHVIPNSMQVLCALSHSFINYISEGSVSISTCKFEVEEDERTADPNTDLSCISHGRTAEK